MAKIYKEIPESSRRPVVDGLTGLDEVTRIDVKHLNMKNSSATEQKEKEKKEHNRMIVCAINNTNCVQILNRSAMRCAYLFFAPFLFVDLLYIVKTLLP